MWLRSYIIVQRYFDEHNSHHASHITMWYSIFVKVIDNLFHIMHSSKSSSDLLKEGEDDVKFAWPLWLGYTRATMPITIRSKALRHNESKKMGLVWIVLCNLRTWSWIHDNAIQLVRSPWNRSALALASVGSLGLRPCYEGILMDSTGRKLF